MALRATRVIMLAARSQSSSGARAKAKSTTTSIAEEQAKKKVSPFMRPLRVSPDLRNFLGVSEIARTEAVKKIWDYIKSKDLQRRQRELYVPMVLRSLHSRFFFQLRSGQPNSKMDTLPDLCKLIAARTFSTQYKYVKEADVEDFLKAVGNGVETHKEKIQQEIGDMNQLLLVRTMKLKKMGIPCKHRKLILRYTNKYRLGLWRPRIAEP